jgi:hypothetical protein
MQSFLRIAAILLGVAAPHAGGALAMRFSAVAVPPDQAILQAAGTIAPGDADRLTSALAELDGSGRTLLAVAVDSGGGNINEAEQMAAIIRTLGLTVMIPDNSVCASACFLLLAASPHRLAAPTARIGVHSASQNGAETGISLAVTTLMARAAANLGVPPAIIGKMVATTPDRVEWLDAPDLALMEVASLGVDPHTLLRRPPPAEPAAPADYARGQADRRTWNAWFGGLQGAYRQGALFAQSQGMEGQEAACYGPDNTHRGDFTLGCINAQRKLAPLIDAMRSSREYAGGWNSAVVAVPARQTVEHIYQGVYFCGSRIGRVTLKVFARSDSARRHALFVFGPHDIGSGIPSGSFTVAGVIDVTGGMLDVSPEEWVSRPPDYGWFGLNGWSDDGGKTFRGALVDSTGCTRFTLARQTPPAGVR